ncbi:MAG: metal ABC transporter ATP-binding protein [Clostridia bacterium]|nr:metal ABC transporter ATP-binding protein [Clostridia bacterium]
MALITVENLTKRFSGNTVLLDVSFAVERGDTLYIVGENGSGKTTLIKLLLGLMDVSSGKIVFDGINKNQIGYMPQQNEIQSDFPASVSEIVMSGFLNRATLMPFYNKKHKEIAEDIMKKLHIEELKNASFRDLSGGQKQRVLLCRALCAANGVLLLDEPLTALDPLASAEFYDVLADLKKQGVTVIIISHDVQCAVKYGDKILHLGRNETFFGTSHEYCHSEIGKKMLVEGHSHD